jgi:hypothetical protein
VAWRTSAKSSEDLSPTSMPVSESGVPLLSMMATKSFTCICTMFCACTPTKATTGAVCADEARPGGAASDVRCNATCIRRGLQCLGHRTQCATPHTAAHQSGPHRPADIVRSRAVFRRCLQCTTSSFNYMIDVVATTHLDRSLADSMSVIRCGSASWHKC